MSLPVYVTNFDELADHISVGDVTVNVDTSRLEDILLSSFPHLLKLLHLLADSPGVFKCKGFFSHGEPVSFIPSSDIALTGFSFSQSSFDCSDNCSLKIISPDSELLLLDSVFLKDSFQHIRFDRFFPVPAGFEILISPSLTGLDYKTLWFDLQFLELL